MIEKQTTIKSSVEITGEGMHTPKINCIRLLPAPGDTGIRWQRTDVPGTPVILSNSKSVVGTERCISLGDKDVMIHTVEHVLAALRGMGIDNCTIELEGEEPPFGDGSAKEYVEKIAEVGVEYLPVVKSTFTLNRSYLIKEGDSYLLAAPSSVFRVTGVFINDYKLSHLTHQIFSYFLDAKTFPTKIAPARTFIYSWEAQKLINQGWVKSKVAKAMIIPPDAEVDYRMEQELVRHKILDLIGDLSLLGSVVMDVIAYRSNHRLNCRFVEHITNTEGSLIPVGMLDDT